MKIYPHLSARVFNTPLLIHPAKLDAVIAGLGERLLGAAPLAHEAGGPTPGLFVSGKGEPTRAGYQLHNDVALIEVSGLLVHKGRLEADSSYLQGYQEIAAQFDAALASKEVGSILFLVDSPGGEVSGAFDLAEKIRSARGVKPLAAIANDLAASAAYLIGSAADTFAVTQTGMAGSIGVVMRHVDLSQALSKDGVSITQIYAGAHKIDGNPYQPLPAGVRADMQQQVDMLYQMFAQAVADARGVSLDAVRQTEAAIYTGADAVKAGLADRISTPDQMIQDLRARASASRSSRAGARATHSNRSTSMSEHEQGSGGASASPAVVLTPDDLDRARAEGHAEGLKAGMEQERVRASAIMTHAEAAGRQALAQQCVAQGLSVEQTGALLAASPREATPAAATAAGFQSAMAALGNPRVQPDADKAGAPDEAALITNMVALVQGGRKA